MQTETLLQNKTAGVSDLSLYNCCQRDAVRIELTSVAFPIIHNRNIIPPSSLRWCILNLTHGCHQGFVKTEEHLPTKMWLPGIYRWAEHK